MNARPVQCKIECVSGKRTCIFEGNGYLQMGMWNCCYACYVTPINDNPWRRSASYIYVYIFFSIISRALCQETMFSDGRLIWIFVRCFAQTEQSMPQRVQTHQLPNEKDPRNVIRPSAAVSWDGLMVSVCVVLVQDPPPPPRPSWDPVPQDPIDPETHPYMTWSRDGKYIVTWQYHMISWWGGRLAFTLAKRTCWPSESERPSFPFCIRPALDEVWRRYSCGDGLLKPLACVSVLLRG